MTIRDFALPDLGEGLTESELVSWRVAIGDTIELNQIIAEVETAKALVELPSPFAGVVSKFYAEAGTTVAVGAPIVAVEVADAATAGLEATAPDAPARAAERTAERTSERTDAAPIEREPVLVGYGPPVEGGARPHRRSRSPLAGQALSDGDTVPGVGEPAVPTSDATSPDAPSSDMPSSDMTSPDAPTPDRTGAAVHSPRSTPPVRALARELGVDLAAVAGTGDGGLVTRDDVRAFAATSGLDSVHRLKLVYRQNRQALSPAISSALACRSADSQIPCARIRDRQGAISAMWLAALSLSKIPSEPVTCSPLRRATTTSLNKTRR